MATDARYAADVVSVDAIITAMYEVVSGPAGPRDWARDRHLFHPQARLMRGLPPGSPPADPPTPGLRVMSLAGFEDHVADRLAAEDFYEIEIGREEFRFGRFVHALSAYSSHRRPEEPPFARGINSIQLWWDGGRWWIMGLIWDWEGDGVRIPDSLARKV